MTNNDKELENHRKEILDRQKRNMESYEKAIFFVANGGLSVSLFLHKNINTSINRCTLWFFGTSVILMLISFLISHHALEKALEYHDEQQRNNQFNNNHQILNKVVISLNYLSCALCIAGIISVLKSL